MRRYLLALFVLLNAVINTASAKDWNQLVDDPNLLHQSIKFVTDVMVHDIYSPPVASRIYAYTTIAAYEAALPAHSAFLSFAGQLKGLHTRPQPDSKKQYSFSLAAIHAALVVSKNLIISEQRIDEYDKSILIQVKQAGMPNDVFNNSVAYGQLIADYILVWASQDQYRETRSLDKYTVDDDEKSWKPTPPAYMKAVEPNWSKLRTFIIDSAQQFKPQPPPIFSTQKDSEFYIEALKVYKVNSSLTTGQKLVANFWDCNPFKMNVKGHVMFATKKISPGGHWINITRLACYKAKTDFIATAEAYARVSVALADAFISCWDEKYRSNVIRPETYINQYIDKKWTPILQTPPFPEYTSGHSVVSAAASTILTHLFKQNFSFTDSTEVEFGLPVRKFKSFKAAAEEAAMSRFYGGIHYLPSIQAGLHEGYLIGNFIQQKIQTKK